MNQIQEILHEFVAAIQEGRPRDIIGLTYELRTEVGKGKQFPDDAFGFLIEFLSRDDVLDAREGIWAIFLMFEADWEKLTNSQRERLLGPSELLFKRTQDQKAALMIAELLGEYFKDEQALDVLIRLAQLEDASKRVEIPHGLEHLIRANPSPSLKLRVLEILTDMSRDENEEVRKEAANSRVAIEGC